MDKCEDVQIHLSEATLKELNGGKDLKLVTCKSGSINVVVIQENGDEARFSLISAPRIFLSHSHNLSPYQLYVWVCVSVEGAVGALPVRVAHRERQAGHAAVRVGRRVSVRSSASALQFDPVSAFSSLSA